MGRLVFLPTVAVGVCPAAAAGGELPILGVRIKNVYQFLPTTTFSCRYLASNFIYHFIMIKPKEVQQVHQQ